MRPSKWAISAALVALIAGLGAGPYGLASRRHNDSASSPAPATTTVTSTVRPGLAGVHVLGWGLHEPWALAVSGSDLFVANPDGFTVTEVSARTGKLVRVIAGSAYKFSIPYALAVSGTNLFVANGGGESITILPTGQTMHSPPI